MASAGFGDQSSPVAGFRSARDADRRIAGVSAAGRAVRALADAGQGTVRLCIGDGAPLAPATRDDIERLRGSADLILDRGAVVADTPLPSAWEIIRTTGKPGDGLVSRWLNRPISRRLTWLVLRIPAARPLHVTLINAAFALAMIPVLIFGGETGLLLGGILFQTASVLDGVDGEMARATFRTSPAGATLDSIVDIATNLIFVASLTVNLALRDGGEVGWIGALAVAQAILGGALIGRRVRTAGASLGFDMFKKRSLRIRGAFDLAYWVVQTLTGRDCFAFLFMVLIMAGLERTALFIFTGVGSIWLLYVIVSLLPIPRLSSGVPAAAKPDGV
jgi:phosphatidylglycerophosphate synthase